MILKYEVMSLILNIIKIRKYIVINKTIYTNISIYKTKQK